MPLKRHLGLLHVFCIATGAMVSSGIFVLPGIAHAKAGPAVILSYLIAGLVASIGMLSAAELVTAMKELSDIGKQAVDWDRRTACDVAFIVSEDTPMFQAAANGELMRFELEDKHGLLIDGCNRKWGVAGIPFDIYELHDLARPDFPGDNYKLFVFVNCAMISAAAAAGIQRWQCGS